MVINLFFIITYISVYICRFRDILIFFITMKVDNLDNQKFYFILSLLVTYVGNLDTNIGDTLHYLL